jgi:pimeloyl-ACP methyl ester carboxylesterase
MGRRRDLTFGSHRATESFAFVTDQSTHPGRVRRLHAVSPAPPSGSTEYRPALGSGLLRPDEAEGLSEVNVLDARTLLRSLVDRTLEPNVAVGDLGAEFENVRSPPPLFNLTRAFSGGRPPNRESGGNRPESLTHVSWYRWCA